MERDADQPGRELRSLFELVEVSEGVDIRLLHHVLDIRFVIHHGRTAR